ncbi:MAG: urease accessory protein UreE [Succinivibrio sp.]
MLPFTKIVNEGVPSYTLSLGMDDRVKSRIIAISDQGEQIAISIERGRVLKDGELLQNEEGVILQINSSFESVSTVTAANSHELTRLAYHLGNRHVPLQISSDGFLRYQVDHVLDEMVEKLGGSVKHEQAKFDPENGAYAHHHHEHSHEHHEHHHH